MPSPTFPHSSHPQLVRPIDDQIMGAIGIDRAVVIAVGRGHVATPALGLQVIFAHQSAELFMVDDDALMAKLGADSPIAVSLELVADRLHATDDLGIIERRGRHIVEGGSGQTHQPASLRDGETIGPAMTDVISLLGRATLVSAPCVSSISIACLPSSRSSDAILTSYACSKSSAWASSSRAPASYLLTQMRIS